MNDYLAIIKAKREEKGISQNKLAKMVGISQPYMNQIEQGTRNPTVPVLLRICKILELPMLGGTEPKDE